MEYDREGSMITPKEMLDLEREVLYDNPSDTLAVMIYEMGAVAQNLMYAKNQHGDDRAKNSLYANALIEISDLVTQCAILAEKLKELSPTMGFKPEWDDLVNTGRQRMVARMNDLLNKEQRNPSMRDE